VKVDIVKVETGRFSGGKAKKEESVKRPPNKSMAEKSQRGGGKRDRRCFVETACGKGDWDPFCHN